MRKSIIIALIVSCFLFSGCGNNDPKSTLRNFMSALVTKDVSRAKKYVTPESEATLQLVIAGIKDVKDEKFIRDSLDLGEPKIEGDRATIVVMQKGSTDKVNYVLKKVNGQWKVAFDEDTINHMNDDPGNTNQNSNQ